MKVGEKQIITSGLLEELKQQNKSESETMRAKISEIKKTFEHWETEFKEATERIQKSEIS